MERFGNMGFNKTDLGFELIGGGRMGAGRASGFSNNTVKGSLEETK